MRGLDGLSLDRVCRGERQAWNEFVAAAGPLLRGVLWRMLSRSGRGDETADVLQEVFVRLVRDDFRVLRQFDPQRARLGTWLGVVATSAALDWLRKSAPAHAALDEIDDRHLAVEAASDEAQGLAIPPELLPPRQALILKLLYEDDMDVAEVAKHLHIEAQTVRSLRHKAIQRLRAFLAEDRTRRG